jgi:hypothetical protein
MKSSKLATLPPVQAPALSHTLMPMPSTIALPGPSPFSGYLVPRGTLTATQRLARREQIQAHDSHYDFTANKACLLCRDELKKDQLDRLNATFDRKVQEEWDSLENLNSIRESLWFDYCSYQDRFALYKKMEAAWKKKQEKIRADFIYLADPDEV